MYRLRQLTDRMAEGIRRTGRKTGRGALLPVLILTLLAGAAFPSWALSAGTYLVTMSPSYTDPETGRVEDPGNNEAIGQGMTEKLCGPAGLLEVDADGRMYLTVRYYLSQFVSDVSFEERSGASYSTLPWEKMQTRAPVDGSSDIDEKYGFTDYRMPVSNTDSVFRGKAYVEPMGRNVVYFFTFSNPVPGSGDFVTAAIEKEPETAEEIIAEIPAEEVWPEEAWPEEAWPEEEPDSSMFIAEAAEGTENGEVIRDVPDMAAADGVSGNGTGNADDPVTGIPEKPGTQAYSKEKETSAADGYHLNTVYDLSDVPMDEARRRTDSMLKEAVGITGMTKTAETADSSVKEANGSRLMMQVLLGVSGILIVWFAAAQLGQAKGRKEAARSRAVAGETAEAPQGSPDEAMACREEDKTKGRDA